MQVNIRQKKITNRPDYLLNDNMIVNVKDFDYSLVQINKLSFKGVFIVNIYYIKYILTKSPNRVSIDRADNGEDFLYLFLGDAGGRIEENDRIKYLAFTPTEKKQRTIKKLQKT